MINNALSYLTTYNWYVVANSEFGFNGISETWNFTTEATPQPPVASILVSPSNGNNSLTIGENKFIWNSSKDAINYNVYITNGTKLLYNINVQDTFVVYKADKAMTYYWYVVACNGYGCSSNSETWSFTTIIPPPPSVPPVLAYPANNDTNVTSTILSWNKVTDATRYMVSVSLNSNFTQVVYSNYSYDTTTFFSGSSFIKYYWRVSAYNNWLCSNASETWLFTTGQLPVPAPPVLISPVKGATNVNIANIKLSWVQSAGALDYTVYVSTTADSLKVIFKNTTKDYYAIIDNLKYQTTYYWYVTACNSFGCSEKSEVWSFTTVAGFVISPPQISDASLKTNITPITGSLNKLLQLNGVYFNWDTLQNANIDFEHGRQIGLIAQDVQTVIPEIVKVDKLGYHYINYNPFAPVFIEAIKELDTKNNVLNSVVTRYDTKIDSLKTVIANYESRFANIETMLSNCCQNANAKTLQGNSFGNSKEFANTDINSVIHITPDNSINSPVTELYQNRPNPFTTKTTFTYQLGKTGFVELEIHSEVGAFIAKLVDMNQEEGSFSIDWNTYDIAPGIYFYSLKVDGQLWVKKAVRIK